ncbi:MAG: alpha-ketoacid dehydrogenase subunit beta [Alphaproteobacteria bacterium]|nr:alpha-ketoacid dehydrogenase subunit beta [Alphaproteobacteria bacterium]
MTRVISFREAIRDVLDERLAADPRVLLIGEDIGIYGGAFGVTRGLVEKYPDRVIETPISENSFVGVAVGAAMGGYRPVVELMFMDFVTLAMDQIVNHAAKIEFMYAGQLKTPVVIRLPGGGGRGYGASHSQSLEGWFTQVPGLTVLAPATPADVAGLLNSAMDQDSPTIFVENKLLYDVKGPVPDISHRTPIGKARIVTEGEDLTIVTYGRMVQVAEAAAASLAELGLSTEVLDLRSLRPLDGDGIQASVSRTGRLAILSEAPPSGGVAAEVAALAAGQSFDALRAPILRLSAQDTPIPSATRLERHVFPTAEALVEAIATTFLP